MPKKSRLAELQEELANTKAALAFDEALPAPATHSILTVVKALFCFLWCGPRMDMHLKAGETV